MIEEWPREHLEAVPHCPVCGNSDRTIIHERLIDVTFFTANGQWNLWRCHSCDSGYLDPRPDKASIGQAYGTYYTHADEHSLAVNAGWRRWLGNGYRNWRFGTQLKPASRLGPIAAMFAPRLRRLIESSYRYLPRPNGSRRRRLLDFGCGNGAFLRLAQDAGWRTFGVEPDPSARKLGRARKIDIRASLEEFENEKFDAVMLSHVVEHVHQPTDLLAELFDRMSPGAFLYVDTPNMNAVGHGLYGRHWRGLEAPRHLLLFNESSMRKALAKAGFVKVRFHECPGALQFTELQSRRIEAGANPYDDKAKASSNVPDAEAMRRSLIGPHSEFLRVTARRA